MKLLIAAGSAPAFFAEISILIVAGAVIAYICYRIGLLPIVGFLIAGVCIGPNGFQLVMEQELVDAAAEVGVILLLFTIGIEFSLERLAGIQRLIFGGGGMQVGLATLATLGVLMLFGVGWQAGLFTGFLVALSSTAIVLKLLGDRGETSAPHGQLALGLLIFQDLAIIVMVMFVPILGGEGGTATDVLIALGKALGIIVLVLVFARRVMPRVLEAVARTCSAELFLLTVIAICFGTAYLTSLADVSLSLGAFLAGLIVSESRFSEHAFGEIMPLQIIFSATFFVSVGMLLDLGFLMQNLPLVLSVVGLVLLVKVVTTGGSVLALGYGKPVALTAGLCLAQVGEFSFVLERAGREVGLYPAGLGEAGSQTFIAATVILMILTPFLTEVGVRWGRRMKATEPAGAMPEAAPVHEAAFEGENHVIVAGYGKAARKLVRVLHGSRIPYVITTLSPDGAAEAGDEGYAVLFGDASRQRTLALAGIERAKLLVIADDDPAMAHRITTVARIMNPTLQIVVRTRYVAEIEPLEEAGVDRVVSEELESIVQLFADVLRDYQIAPEEIESYVAAVRERDYAALREAARVDGKPVVVCEGLDQDCLDARKVRIRAGAAAVGQSLADLNLDRYGLRADMLIRGRRIIRDAAPAMTLQVGDELLLAGSAEGFAGAADLFRTHPLDQASAVALAEQADRRPAIDTNRTVELGATSGCAHLDQVRPVVPGTAGCEECLQSGDTWVHLRICMTCGHVGCCDSSRNKHATRHAHETGHPIVRSLEPGETWGWCYVDQILLEPDPDPVR